MTADRYQANIITKNPTDPAGPYETSAAPGVWSLDEALTYTKAGVWPTAGNLPVSVENVFSTYLYDGTGSAQTITNGIDLSGEGGLVWTKSRSDPRNHSLHDSARGVTCLLKSNATNAQYCDATQMASFNSNGFTVGSDGSSNTNGDEYASWTFRKAPKFFTCVTYTGDSNATQTVNHDLGSVPGMIIIKKTDGTSHWTVYHRSAGSYRLRLNTTEAQDENGFWATSPTDTAFTLSNSDVKSDGATYVAYLFAHNDGDGEFGPDGDADIIKCGSFTGAGYSESEQFNVNLGFEPQWIMYKRTDSSTGGGWFMVDNMRGWRPETSSNFEYLQAQSLDAEAQSGALGIRSDGFRVREGLGRQYIYIAIRRGPMAVPESATDVFAIQAQAGGYTVNRFASSGFPVDFVLDKEYDDPSNWLVYDRLRGGKADLKTNSTAAEATNSPAPIGFDYNDGITEGFYNSANNVILPMWKRAPSFCDVVAYTGNGAAGRTVSHNLGVAPEMIWVNGRNLSSQDWAVYHSATGTSKYLKLNEANAALGIGRITGTSDTTFTLDSDDIVNKSGDPYIAYLFASLDNVSKCGSYTGNGSSQTIECGFTSGARYVLVKRADSTGDWYVWDTTRGIVAGNDPHLSLNSTAAQVTTDDSVDPDSSGFAVNQNTATNINVSSATYIFYAIA